MVWTAELECVSVTAVWGWCSGHSPGADGLICGGNSRLTTTFRLLVMAALVALFGSSCFFGGRGGSFAGSYAGARTWYSVLPLLPFVLTEPSESVDTPDAIVDIDSDDSRRVTLRSDDLRGGKAGDCWLGFRGGGRGGRAGEILGAGCSICG
jgi:hypothetical protein